MQQTWVSWVWTGQQHHEWRELATNRATIKYNFVPSIFYSFTITGSVRIFSTFLVQPNTRLVRPALRFYYWMNRRVNVSVEWFLQIWMIPCKLQEKIFHKKKKMVPKWVPLKQWFASNVPTVATSTQLLFTSGHYLFVFSLVSKQRIVFCLVNQTNSVLFAKLQTFTIISATRKPFAFTRRTCCDSV